MPSLPHPYPTLRIWMVIALLSLLPFYSYGQMDDLKVNLSFHNKSTERILDEISLQTGYYFTFNPELISVKKKISIELNNFPLNRALDSIFRNPGLQYQIIDRNIVIYSKNPLAAHPVKTDSLPAVWKIRGKIRDAQNGSGLPFATILIDGSNRGSMSNLNGEFSINLPAGENDPILIVSMIGYKNAYHHVSQPGKEQMEDISLERDVISLQEVIIRYQSPAEILNRVLDNIPGNYFDEPSAMTAYFREFVQKEKNYINFSEAVIEIAKSPYNNFLRSDDVRVLKGRKLQNISPEDTILMKIQSGIASSLQLDIVKSQPDFLSRGFEQYYRMEFRNILSFRNRQVYHIAFFPREGIDRPLYRGDLYIGKDDFALVAAEFEVPPEDLRRDPGRFLIRKSRLVKVRPQKTSYRVEYRQTGEKYHLSMVQARVDFRLRKRGEWIGSSYGIGIEMAVTLAEPGIRNRIPRRERLKPGTILADEDFRYDPSFWGEYNIIEPEVSLKEALEKMGIAWEEY